MTGSSLGDFSVTTGRPLRRMFSLPEEDIETLEAMGLPWECTVENATQWLLIHDWLLPGGFTAVRATIAIRIVAGYPSAALDMVYVHPRLARADGRPIGGLSDSVVDGKTFQQWSRHYTPANPWRPGVDSIVTHLRAIASWFAKAVA